MQKSYYNVLELIISCSSD